MRRVGYAPSAPGSSRREYGLAPNELKFNAELRVAAFPIFHRFGDFAQLHFFRRLEHFRNGR
ncbi:hypothetical protein J2W42_003311 [Rhizobium tibeticum]|nr:hypothetical protein [Rhizobium tibeticum]